MLDTKFDKIKITKLLKSENDYILDILTNFNVPDCTYDGAIDDYLTKSKGKGIKSPTDSANSVAELEERLTSIKNKMKTKKRKVSEKKSKKQGMKKLNKNKEFKKVLLTANKTIKKEQSDAGDKDLSAASIKPKQIVKPIYNAEGKIVFSKFDFAAHNGTKPKKKSKSEKVIKNPKQVLNTMKEIDTKIMELESKGEQEKVKEIKKDLAWKKAFDKVDGKKVKDDKRLLYKSIKRKTIKKKKSKEQWIERKNKVEQKIQSKQKKRTENINKKLKDKKNSKLRKMSKKGRVIPGF